MKLFSVSENGRKNFWTILAMSAEDAKEFFLENNKFMGSAKTDKLADVSLSDVYADESDIDLVGDLKAQYGYVNITEKACAYIIEKNGL